MAEEGVIMGCCMRIGVTHCDLSHPSESSVNDSIPSQVYRLTYVTIDDTILNIFMCGRSTILPKVNIKNAITSAPVRPISSISGQLSKTFQLLIKSQSIFIAQTSSLYHRCLVSLETEIQFCDAFRHKVTAKILEHVIDYN